MQTGTVSPASQTACIHHFRDKEEWDMKHFAKEQLVQARRTDLYSFLINNHVSRFRKDGASLHPKDNQSLSIKRGYTGYKDFSTNETGNSVDFLVRHMGYALDEAVFALCGEAEATDGRAGTASDITVKPPASFRCCQLTAPAPPGKNG